MSNIKLFGGLEIPHELEDLLLPLLPYLLNFYSDKSSIRLEFYFPSGTIQYDIEMMQKYFYDISMHIDYSEPVYSIENRYEPVIPHRRLGEVVTCNFKLNDYTRAKKQTRTTERSEEPTNDPPEN